MRQRILILGASGFVGSKIARHLIRYHQNIYEVKFWDKNVDGSILLAKTFESGLLRHEPDIVVNCAWQTTRSPGYRNDKRNYDWVNPVVNLHQICNALSVRCFSFGTKIETDEEFQDDYVLAKRLTVSALMRLSLLKTSCWVRPSFIYSLEDRRPHIVREFLENPERFLQSINSPNSINDFIHINDVIYGLLTLVQNDSTGIQELGSGVRLSNIDFLRLIVKNESLKGVKSLLGKEEEGHSHNSWRPRFTLEMLKDNFI